MAQAAIREVALMECFEHPIVEDIKLWIKKAVVWLEGRAQQTALPLELCLDRRPSIRQHPAETSDRPAVTDEGFEKADVVPYHIKCAVRIQQHEAEIERQPKFLQNAAGAEVLLGFNALAHIDQALRIAVLNTHIDMGESASDELPQTVRVDLIGAAAHLEGNLASEPSL